MQNEDKKQAGLAETAGEEFVTAMTPFAKLVGHALAAVCGLALIMLVSLVPVAIKAVLGDFGIHSMDEEFDLIEQFIVVGDVILFGIVLFAGIVKFAVAVYKDLKDKVNKTLDD